MCRIIFVKSLKLRNRDRFAVKCEKQRTWTCRLNTFIWRGASSNTIGGDHIIILKSITFRFEFKTSTFLDFPYYYSFYYTRYLLLLVSSLLLNMRFLIPYSLILFDTIRKNFELNVVIIHKMLNSHINVVTIFTCWLIVEKFKIDKGGSFIFFLAQFKKIRL